MSNIDTIVPHTHMSMVLEIYISKQKKPLMLISHIDTMGYFSRNCRKTYEFPHPPVEVPVLTSIQDFYDDPVDLPKFLSGRTFRHDFSKDSA